MTQYLQHWNLFGTLGPAPSGPFLPDDAPPTAEDEIKHQGPSAGAKHYSEFESAALRFYESSGADVDKLFDTFDTDGNGYIDLQELMACAVICGVGFSNMGSAEETFKTLDEDKDGKITRDEFKRWLLSVEQ